MPQYTEKQIEIANLINSIGDVPAGTMDEILAIVETSKQNETITTPDETETQLKTRILNEPDWRKRVALSAMIISNSLK